MAAIRGKGSKSWLPKKWFMRFHKHHKNSCQSVGWFHLPFYFLAQMDFVNTNHPASTTNTRPTDCKSNLKGNVWVLPCSTNLFHKLFPPWHWPPTPFVLGLQHPSQLAQWWQIIGCGSQGQRVRCRLRVFSNNTWPVPVQSLFWGTPKVASITAFRGFCCEQKNWLGTPVYACVVVIWAAAWLQDISSISSQDVKHTSQEFCLLNFSTLFNVT